jgi:hypothetical protein
MKKCSDLFEEQTEFLNIIYISFDFQGFPQSCEDFGYCRKEEISGEVIECVLVVKTSATISLKASWRINLIYSLCSNL